MRHELGSIYPFSWIYIRGDLLLSGPIRCGSERGRKSETHRTSSKMFVVDRRSSLITIQEYVFRMLDTPAE